MRRIVPLVALAACAHAAPRATRLELFVEGKRAGDERWEIRPLADGRRVLETTGTLDATRHAIQIELDAAGGATSMTIEVSAPAGLTRARIERRGAKAVLLGELPDGGAVRAELGLPAGALFDGPVLAPAQLVVERATGLAIGASLTVPAVAVALDPVIHAVPETFHVTRRSRTEYTVAQTIEGETVTAAVTVGADGAIERIESPAFSARRSDRAPGT